MISASLLGIVEEIEALTPAQRRQLQRRLYASGLFVPEVLYSDQNRLALAPALGEKVQANRRTHPTRVPPVDTAAPLASKVEKADYRPPVSGKIVVGAPAPEPKEADPHAMPPLPGQAPERPIGVIFDGGSKGNPGQGYGSYALRWPGEQQQLVRLRFGDHVTNNEAEYDTLITALEAIIKRLRDAGADPKTARVDIRGDSLLVINQVQGEWQCKQERLQTRCRQVRALLQQLGEWRLTHHDRSRSVEALGH